MPSSQAQGKLPSCPSGTFDQTVIFFDWDDTCFPSTYLASNGYRLDTPMERVRELAEPLRELEVCVIDVLRLAMTFGKVVIVTNAENGWVQLSAEKYMPNLLPLLSQIHILSARTTFESSFPDSPLKWKYYAFQQCLVHSFAAIEKRKNIISLGDSHVEREAIRAITRDVPNTICKSVKFSERPTFGQLRRQIELVFSCFQYIMTHEADLDLQLTVTVNPEGSTQGRPEEEEEEDEEQKERKINEPFDGWVYGCSSYESFTVKKSGVQGFIFFRAGLL
jgi:hypothetical protein